MNDQRKCMDPSTLEAITMLDENSDLWDARDIQEIALSAKRGRGDDEEEELEDVELEAYESYSDDENGAANFDLDVDIAMAK
jgi:hypothetical protein